MRQRKKHRVTKAPCLGTAIGVGEVCCSWRAFGSRACSGSMHDVYIQLNQPVKEEAKPRMSNLKCVALMVSRVRVAFHWQSDATEWTRRRAASQIRSRNGSTKADGYWNLFTKKFMVQVL